MSSQASLVSMVLSCLCCCFSLEEPLFFRQVSDYCKRVSEAGKLAYSNKSKQFNHFQKLGPSNFW